MTQHTPTTPAGGPGNVSWGRWFVRSVLTCGILVLGGCGLIALALRPPLTVRAALGTRFSTDEWANAPRTSDARYQMLPDLLYRHRLVGLTPDEAVALLGPATQRDIGPQGWGWVVYYLGDDSGFFDTWYNPHLILRVEDGRVSRVEQATQWIGEIANIVVRQE